MLNICDGHFMDTLWILQTILQLIDRYQESSGVQRIARKGNWKLPEPTAASKVCLTPDILWSIDF